MSILNHKPQLIHAGDTLQFNGADSRYPSPEYSATFVIKSSPPVTFTTSIDHTVTIVGAQTSGIERGTYPCFMVYNNGSQVTVPKGSIMVEPAATDEVAPTWAEATLAALQDAIAGGNAMQGFKYSNVNGQEFELFDYTDIMALRDRLRVEVSQEQARRGMKPSVGGAKTIRTIFGRR